ncbi:MAG: RluA family pseudouridine synthase [Ginsengibacter sp.]
MKGFSVVFENEDIVAVNKDAGVLTIPDRHDETQLSLYKALNNHYGKIFVVHRLDRDTSGLILFAKNEAAHKYFSQLFEKRNIQKKYLGIVRGSLHEKQGTIDEPIAEHPVKKGLMIVQKKGKPSITNFKVLEDYGIYSLVEFEIESGRTHQIRIHAKTLGHPIICDPLYGDGKPVFLSSFKKKYRMSHDQLEERPIMSRPALHSSTLDFEDSNSEKFHLEAPLPKDMKALLNQLKKNRG